MQNRVLFFEHKDNYSETKKLLEKAGCQVLATQDREQVFILMNTSTPDVIIIDSDAPNCNGYELCKKIKADFGSKSISIIVLSDHHKMEDAYLYLGVQKFIIKPVEESVLFDSISKQLQRNMAIGSKKCKILVHNTDIADAHKVQELLNSDRKWIVDVCDNSADLLFKSLTQNPDIILIDLFIGEMAPEEIIKALRSFTKFRKTIILTYYSTKADSSEDTTFQAKMLEIRFMRETCHEAGANAYIGPLSSDTFVSLMSEYHVISI